MLNISENSISQHVQMSDFDSYQLLKQNLLGKLTLWLVSVLFVVILITLFLPWTQNISAKGYVTTRSPQQRPQAIQSVLAGRLEKWYVREGDFVQK